MIITYFQKICLLKMQKKWLLILLQITLFYTKAVFAEPSEPVSELLSLKQIDLLIDTSAYNDALKELSKYIAAHPNDFDRAQKRIKRIMRLRSEYNKGAEALVGVIKTGDESKSEKLSKIAELENSELAPNENVIEFTNLARRTVTLGEVLILYEKIMREGAALVKAEKYYQAALKFQEGFAVKNEVSDIVFDSENDNDAEGIPVVYDSDITEPVRSSVNNVKSLLAGNLVSSSMEARINDCERAYSEYMKALSLKNLDHLASSYKNVRTAFSNYAELRNKIIKEAEILDKADKVANERNPLLFGTSYITFQEKFILGDESNPDTGIIGAFDAYFNRRVEAMKEKTGQVIFEILNRLIDSLPENKIYSLALQIDSEMKNVSVSKSYAQYALFLHDLYNLEKNIDGTTVGQKHSVYASSLSFVNEYLTDLNTVYNCVIALAGEKMQPEKIDKEDLSEATVSRNLQKLLSYEKIKSDSRDYLALVEREQKKEKEYFDKKTARQKELDELIRISGGRLNISSSRKRNTAGIQISDDPVDFRDQIIYFTSLNRQNLEEASKHSKVLWSYMAYAYAVLAKADYEKYEKLCFACENLFSGQLSESDDELPSELFVKKYPVEARDESLKLNQEITAKKQELLDKLELLAGGEEYRQSEKDYNDGVASLEGTVKDLDSLFARCQLVIDNAGPKIRRYEELLVDADEQYKTAIKLFKKEDFDSANAAVDTASEKYAEALDIEYSEKIRLMREETLNELALKIQRAEYEKVLREVFAIKDKATIAYYSSSFDSAESLLVTAQTKWAKVSTDADPEIEELLDIVKTIKSIEWGRVLVQSDPHYPELSYSLDMAKQSFEKGIKMKKNDKADEAKDLFNLALTNIRNVQNVYPLNKEARLITLKIQQELDPEGFPRQFEAQYNAAHMNANKNERLADLEDLYEINPKFPGLAKEIYEIKDSLGMFPKKEIKKEVKKTADSKIAQARKAFKAAGDDEAKLNAALALANEAIAIDGTSRAAKELKLDIQLKIGATTTAILSQSDEKMYADAARLFNQRRFADAKLVMDRLLTGNAAKKSRKVMDLYNRLLKRI